MTPGSRFSLLMSAIGLLAAVMATAAGSAAGQDPPPRKAPVADAASRLADSTGLSAVPVAARTLGGLLGKRGPSKDGMIKDLTRGRLILKGVRFAAGSDSLEKSIDAEITALAEALEGMDGQYLLSFPAEARQGEPPDTALAARRLARLLIHLQVAGVSQERVTAAGVYPVGLDPKARPPKPGDARPELVPLPNALRRPERS